MTSSTTASEESWSKVDPWLHTCLKTHEQCKQTAEQLAFHPTRLIDVGGDKPVVRLALKEDVANDQRYVALSHCWGKKPMVTLADSNLPLKSLNGDPLDNALVLDDFGVGVPFHKLPQTFQDAVEVTRRLQVRYLWIDALCIFQNSRDDWLAEAPQMNQVYSSAFCVLAATGSMDGAGGLFHERSPSVINTITLPSSISEQESFVFLPLDFWKLNVGDAPLNQRAWVLQERVLPPRIIHFGKTQILWECNTHNCCETFPNGLPEVLQESGRFKSLESDMSRDAFRTEVNTSLAKADTPIKDTINSTDFDGFYLWSRLVEKYCRTGITNERDKLIAVSGLSGRFESKLNDTCLSGLWKSILASQLLWTAEDFDESVWFFATKEVSAQNRRKIYGSRTKNWRAPTWSWASMNGPVCMAYPSGEQPLFSLRDVMYTNGTEPEGNGLKTALGLSITAALFPGILRYNPQNNRWFVAANRQGICSETLEGTAWSGIQILPQKVEKLFPDLANAVLCCAFPDDAEDVDFENPTPVLCLPVIQRHRRKALRGDGTGITDQHISGLIVDQYHQVGVYRRLGVFDVMPIPQTNSLLTGSESRLRRHESQTSTLFMPDGSLLLI